MQIVTPYLLYRSCEDALDWLSRAFGFEEVLRYAGEAGYVNHAEMRVGGDESIMMGNPGEGYRNPKDAGGETVGIYVMVDDVDAHFARAKEAGAEIREEPNDQEYGHRRYTAYDPEGHCWYFAAPPRGGAPEGGGARVATRACPSRRRRPASAGCARPPTGGRPGRRRRRSSRPRTSPPARAR